MRLRSICVLVCCACSSPAPEPVAAPVTDPEPKPVAKAAEPPPKEPVAEKPKLPAQEILLHEEGVENAYPRLSSDGKSIVYQSNRTGKWQIWRMDLESGRQDRLTHDEHDDNFVDLSPDDAWIAFVSNRDGNEELYRMRVDGKGLQRLTKHPQRDIHPYFAPDGKSLLFNSTRDGESLDLYRMTLSDRRVERLTDTAENDTCARFSPDMKTIVFLRNDMTMDDVMLMDVETKEVTNLTDTPRVIDGWPMWSADGKWIYYSTMKSGVHSIHRVRPDGTGDEILTDAAVGEEDARAFVARDGRTLVFNKRHGKTIDILSLTLPS
jgi:Tol biopolymer transport system component